MLTRAGRVVVMDFGLAKGRAEVGTGTISGTPAYMSPEQARGEPVDARADVFSAAVVLAEMLTVGGEGIRARQALWRAVRESPPQVPEGPWAPVLRQALDPQAERRPASARALAHALEEVTLRLPGFEEKRPYPGLASFSAEDAEYFFGREVEVEAIWKKLKRPRLLGLIGPSGAGKSSFLRAGLLPTLPKSWTAVLSTPGARPFQFLAQALAPSLAGDAQAVQSLLRFEDPEIAVPLVARWRQRHEQALIVVDQFEELFTLNPPEVQEAFAELLGRLVLEADVHVLLAMRDDFLFHCHAHEALAPILSDLTPPGPAQRERAPARPGAARSRLRLPLRGRGPGRRDGAGGGPRAGRAAALGLRGLTPLGEAGPGARSAHAGSLQGDRWGGGGARPARGGHAREHRHPQNPPGP